MKTLKIDLVTMAHALATGDVTALEKKLKEWKGRASSDYKEASETMEVIILRRAEQVPSHTPTFDSTTTESLIIFPSASLPARL